MDWGKTRGNASGWREHHASDQRAAAKPRRTIRRSLVGDVTMVLQGAKQSAAGMGAADPPGGKRSAQASAEAEGVRDRSRMAAIQREARGAAREPGGGTPRRETLWTANEDGLTSKNTELEQPDGNQVCDGQLAILRQRRSDLAQRVRMYAAYNSGNASRNSFRLAIRSCWRP